jgi:cation efflux family protein
VLVGYESIERPLHPRPVQHLWAVAAAAVVGFAGNEIVARYRISVGRRIGSAALVADELHARTDGYGEHRVAHHGILVAQIPAHVDFLMNRSRSDHGPCGRERHRVDGRRSTRSSRG